MRARSDLGQLGERLVVVVPVDKGQLHPGVVAQLGRESQRDVQPGVAGPRNHDRLVLSCSAQGASFISRQMIKRRRVSWRRCRRCAAAVTAAK
ncbi:MAG TPA: hypothetical protein VHR39_21150 [Propionibacteriaceae bacterium]|nr:hypothetical protein [Propionibacteriaceae bacterium]